MCDNKSGTALPTIFIDNNRTRVTEWHFKERGDNTGWHKHDYDYVVVPLFSGFLEIDDGTETRTRAEMKFGVPYYRKRGVEHDVINGNDFDCSFVEIELLNN
jgi:hypothetical protein